MNKEKALEKLSELMQRTELQIEGGGDESFERWKRATNVAIEKIFGQDSPHVKEFDGIRYSLGIWTTSTPDSAFTVAKIAGLKRAKELLKSLEDEVLEYWEANDSENIEDTSISSDYIDKDRIEALKKLKTDDFDFSRLVRICEEINIANINRSYITIGALVRILIDHIPPTLGHPTFAMVASYYPGKSLKDTFKRLEEGGRKISDGLIHQTIRRRESLPNFIQVNYLNDIDVLLSEIIRRVNESNA